MVDLHFHLLPRIDDGPPGTPEALALAEAAVAAGTSTVVATPHVSWQWPGNDARTIADAVSQIRQELGIAGIDLEVQRGAEVALTRAVDLPAGELAQLGLGGGPWLLLECPSQSTGGSLELLIGSLPIDPERLLLAHPERIRAFRKQPEILARLVAAGARCQVTAGALSGGYGREVQRFAAWLLEEGLIHVAASDAHAVTGRPPSLAAELKLAGVSDPVVEWLARESPGAVLAGEALPPAPAPPPRRGRRPRVFRRH